MNIGHSSIQRSHFSAAAWQYLTCECSANDLGVGECPSNGKGSVKHLIHIDLASTLVYSSTAA
jgi:hypothetical protein